MKREELLAAAKTCVCGQREQDYGTPEDNFRTIANLWAAYLLAKPEPVDILPADVAAMMALLKIARISVAPSHADSWIDLAGYAACGAEIATEKRTVYCEHDWVYIPAALRNDQEARYVCSECGAASKEDLT